MTYQQKNMDAQFRPELPAPRGRTAFLSILVFSLSLMLTGWISSTKEEEKLQARLAVETVTILAEQDGQIENMIVPEGQHVSVGDPLLNLRLIHIEQNIANLRREVEKRETEWKKSVGKSEIDLAWRMRSLNSEILQTRLKMTELLKTEFDQRIEQQAWKDYMSERNHGLTTTSPDEVFQTVSHQRKLPGEHQFEAMIQLEAARNASEVSQVQLRLCEERLKELQKLRDELPARIRKACGVAEAENRMNAARKKLEEAQSRNVTQQIDSTGFGEVRRYHRRVGERVRQGEKIAEIIDNSRRFLVADVPAEKMSRFVEGEILTLQFPGGKTRQGKVGKRLKTTFQKQGSEMLQIRIEPSGKLWPKLPIGSAVQIVLTGNKASTH